MYNPTDNSIIRKSQGSLKKHDLPGFIVKSMESYVHTVSYRISPILCGFSHVFSAVSQINGALSVKLAFFVKSSRIVGYNDN
jgi:hypothetical protein